MLAPPGSPAELGFTFQRLPQVLWGKWGLVELLDSEQGLWQHSKPMEESGNSELGLFLLKTAPLALIYEQTEVCKRPREPGPEIHEPDVMWRGPRTQNYFYGVVSKCY